MPPFTKFPKLLFEFGTGTGPYRFSRCGLE